MTAIRFTLAELERASDTWGCNCGPAALAAICGLTLDEVRPHFERERPFPGYTNPTLMHAALRSALGDPPGFWQQVPGSRSVGATVSWPRYGLCRIQWEGPWTQPGVPIAARYRQTHWAGAARRPREDGKPILHDDSNVGVWDVNAIGNRSGWCALADWSSKLVPWILES
jgi:hypothetical protein